jgi:hypothetical protein
MRGGKVSLLVASSKTAMASGAEEISSDGVTYHSSKRTDFDVATWSNRGLNLCDCFITG